MGVKYFYNNLAASEETTLTSTSSIDILYPLTNLADHRKTKKVKCSSAETMELKFDLGSSEAVDSLLFLEDTQNGFEWEEIVIEANATDVWTSPSYTKTLTISAQQGKWGVIHEEIASQTLRFWRLTVTNTSGSGYVALGKIFLGSKLELEVDDMSLGWSLSYKDLSKLQKNEYGQVFGDSRARQRKLKGNYSLMGKANLDLMSNMYLTCNTYLPIWLIMDDTEAIVTDKERLCLYSRLTKIPTEKNAHYAIYDFSLDFEELL